MKESVKLRDWIWKALCAIVLEKSYSNLYLKQHLEDLPARDRALATRIVYGTLQNYSFCQAVWKQYASRRVKPRIGILLTFSVYQLLFCDIPAYAIINDAVELAKKKDRSIAGFVNAILHKIDPEAIKYPEKPLERLAFETSLPLWMIETWNRAYGPEKTETFAKGSVSTHPVYVRWNPLRSSKSGIEAYTGSVGSDPDYLSGAFSVQDPGSYQIARFIQAEPGMEVLDLCAAPGTKSFAMAELMENQGRIDALDLYESRAALIEKDRQRLGLDIVQPKTMDGTKIDSLGLYDRILCDVPCSGWGVLSRKPDMKLELSQDLDELTGIQKALLESARDHLKPEGKLVYSTCTLNPQENEEQVSLFLKENPDFVLEAMEQVDLNDEHDGFFMARLARRPQEENK